MPYHAFNVPDMLGVAIAGLPKNLPRIFMQIPSHAGFSWIFMDFPLPDQQFRLGVERQEGGHRHRGGIGEDLWGFSETLWQTDSWPGG